jgi:hypothetical protein
MGAVRRCGRARATPVRRCHLIPQPEGFSNDSTVERAAPGFPSRSARPIYARMLPRPPNLPAEFVPPCLPMKAPKPPSGALWLHEIKLRVIARKDDRASSRHRWRWPRVCIAISVHPHEGWLGQCCLGQTPGSATDLLEAVCGDPSEQENTGANSAIAQCPSRSTPDGRG